MNQKIRMTALPRTHFLNLLSRDLTLHSRQFERFPEFHLQAQQSTTPSSIKALQGAIPGCFYKKCLTAVVLQGTVPSNR